MEQSQESTVAATRARIGLYLAGPIKRKRDIEQGIKFAHELMDLGLNVFVSQLTYYLDYIKIRDWNHRNLFWIEHCDLFFGLPNSPKDEIAYAMDLGKPVFFHKRDLEAWLA